MHRSAYAGETAASVRVLKRCPPPRDEGAEGRTPNGLLTQGRVRSTVGAVNPTAQTTDMPLAGAGLEADAESGAMTCFRHPDRETYVRCGRCDRPICRRCAMDGPVGLRCRDCGKPGPDPLTRLSPSQLAAGVAVGLGAGTIAGFLGLQMGFLLSLCAGPFIGGLIGEGVIRATGYKRGPVVRILVVVGIVGGLLLAAFLHVSLLVGQAGAPGASAIEAGLGMATFYVGSSVLYLAAALFGAFTRLR
jgi:hypothetical protein